MRRPGIPVAAISTETTTNELRKTGISVIGDVRWGTHFCYFYETKRDLLETLVLYFKAGLEAKEFCLWGVSPPLTVTEARRALRRAVPELDLHLAEGALEILSQADWYRSNGHCQPLRVLTAWRKKLNQALAKGYAGLRASGDGGWVQKDDWMAFREYEKQIDAKIADQRSLILCTYPLATSPGDRVFDVAHIHQVAVARRNGRWETVETPGLKKAKAEIKGLSERLEQKVEARTRELRRVNRELRAEIAERKRAEEALRKSEKLFAAFMDHLPGFAWIKDLEGRYVYTNKKALELDPYRDGVIGKTDAELWPAEIAAAYLANDQQVISTRKALQTVEPSLSDAGPNQMLVSKFPILDQDGSVLMVAGAGVDITDLTQAKDALNAQALRYKTLMETSTDSIYVLDAEGNLREANAAFLRRRGYTAAEVKALHVSDWDAQWNREQPREKFRMAVGTSRMFETRHRCRDRSIFDVEVCATSVRIGPENLFFCVTRDITERKQAEERLRRSEEKFKTLFDLAPVGISVLDRQHNVIEANPALEQITRLTKEELLAGTHRRRPILNLDGTPKPPPELPSERAMAESRRINDVQMGFVTENNETIWTQVSAAPLFLPDANAVVITQDISERKRAEQALRESEERFRELAENINEVFWVWSATPGEARLLYVSPAYATIWGRSCESLYASPQSWKAALHPEDRDWVLAEIANLDSEKNDDLTYRIVRPDQSVRWIRDRIFPVRDANSVVVRLAGIAQDVTENKLAEDALRESETKFRELLASNIVGVIFWTVQGHIVHANDLFLKMIGYTRDELREGKFGWKNITPPEYAGADEKAISELLATGTCTPFEKEYIRKDGSRLSVLIGAALLDDEKEMGSSFIMDMTERKKTEEQLVHHTQMLRTLSRRLFEVQEEERRHLARELHDEIGQALTAAKINLQSITGETSNATLARLHETTAILDHLIGQVRQISLDLRPSMLDDLGLVPALRSLIDQQGRRACVEMRFSAVNLPESFDAKTQTTCFRIAQEAITNALRHAHATRVEVELRRDHGNLRLAIHDNGSGFDPGSVQTQAVGLGLIGIKERAALVGGQARIISSPNKGTTIEVSMPLAFRPEPLEPDIEQ